TGDPPDGGPRSPCGAGSRRRVAIPHRRLQPVAADGGSGRHWPDAAPRERHQRLRAAPTRLQASSDLMVRPNRRHAVPPVRLRANTSVGATVPKVLRHNGFFLWDVCKLVSEGIASRRKTRCESALLEGSREQGRAY